jgi:2'-5' RNA ligase
VRAFIGTFLSSTAQNAAETFARRLAAQSNDAVRPVPTQSAHITHAFLGEVDESLALAIVRDIGEVMLSMAPVRFRLGRPEILGARREPRLVLANVVQGADEIAAVTRRIGERIRRHPELARTPRARNPHVTLARFRRGAGPGEGAVVRGLLEGSARMEWPEDCLESVELIRSDLRPGGPAYQVVGRARAGRSE